LPFAEYAWRWTHLVVVLVIGIALNAGRLLGAGDAKFAAAAAPFVALADVGRMMMLLGACLLAGYVTHRIAKYSPLRRLVPDWDSWTAGKRFPMGYPLATALAIYLAWPLLG
jgi:prepilin peptidase CpaA